MAIINSKLFTRRINSSQLSDFFERENKKQYRHLSLDQKLAFAESLCSADEIFKQHFNVFLLEQLKYTINSNIVTVPIKIVGSRDVLSSNTIFENKVKSFKIINEINSLSDEDLENKFEEDSNDFVDEDKLSIGIKILIALVIIVFVVGLILFIKSVI